MTEDEFNKVSTDLSERFVDIYCDLCSKFPKLLVIIAMTGALAACVTEAGFARDKAIAALNSAFDDIEGEG